MKKLSVCDSVFGPWSFRGLPTFVKLAAKLEVAVMSSVPILICPDTGAAAQPPTLFVIVFSMFVCSRM